MIQFIPLTILLLASSVWASNWPQWRGPERDGHAAPDETLNEELLKGAEPLWQAPIGGGFSSPIIWEDKVIVLDEQDGREVANCLDVRTGKTIWKSPYAGAYKDEWGAGPRATPFTDGKKVWVQSCNGEFHCLNFETGKIVWGFNFQDYGVTFLGSKAREGTARRRGNNGSSLLDGDAVLVPVGSPQGATIVCLEKDKGTLIWKAGEDEAAYSALMVGTLAGVRQAISYTADSLLSVDRVSGKVLWRVPLASFAKRHTMTPLIHGNHILVTSVSLGMICFEVVRDGEKITAVEKWRNPNLKINLATPVIVGDHVFGHGPSQNFICADLISGREKWAQPGFGKELSSTLAVNGKLLSITDGGEAVVLRASPEKYDELLRVQLAGKNWNHPALAQGCLFVRDQRTLACFRVK